MSYHYGPSAVGNLLNPKPKSYTRDHMAENRARIAAIQETAQIRAEYEEGLEATKGARFTLSRFAHVAPRVAVPHGEAHMENTDPRPSRKAALPAPEPAKPFVRESVVPRKEAVPSKAEVVERARALARDDAATHKDFISQNARAVLSGTSRPGTGVSMGTPTKSHGTGYHGATASPPPTSPRSMAASAMAGGRSVVPHRPPPGVFLAGGKTHVLEPAPPSAPLDPADIKHGEYGRVPAYLRERQAQWAAEEEERKRRAAEADVPPGMRLMPEAERQETLAMLRGSIEECQAQLGTFKLKITVPSLLQRKAALEEKITKLEAAIKVFSRPRVFVKLDE